MRVFVTGVKGQLGHDVMNELAKRGHEGIGVDIEEMDITDAESVRKVITEANPDVVIHCAAWTAVDLAEDDDKKEKVHQVNAVGTENIAKVCCLSVPFIFPQKLSVLPFFCLFFIIPFSRRKRNRIAHRKKREQNHRFSSGNSAHIFLSLISAQFFSAFFGCTASQIKSPPAHRESSPKFQSWTALLPPV